jgi:molybdate transport system substrate-binding protein
MPQPPLQPSSPAPRSFQTQRRSLLIATAGSSLLGAASPAISGLPEPLMQTIRIAAASDLQFVLPQLLNQFQQDTGLPCVATYGSSGQFARQIAQGLPTDLFMSADDSLVASLVQQKLTKNEGAVYATGRLALIVPSNSPLQLSADWSAALAALKAALQAPSNSKLGDGQLHVGKFSIDKFAIANPEHAPYGRAAQQVLQATGLWTSLQPRLVLGDNIAQAAQFVRTGAAQAGLVALPLAMAPELATITRHTAVPANLHAPLRQRMVILKNAKPQTQQLLAYLLSAPVRAQLVSVGFE